MDTPGWIQHISPSLLPGPSVDWKHGNMAKYPSLNLSGLSAYWKYGYMAKSPSLHPWPMREVCKYGETRVAISRAECWIGTYIWLYTNHISYTLLTGSMKICQNFDLSLLGQMKAWKFAIPSSAERWQFVSPIPGLSPYACLDVWSYVIYLLTSAGNAFSS